MDEYEKKEKENRRVGWLISVGIQLVLLILFYFIIAWKPPFPPVPEYGIELGFATSSGAPRSASAASDPVQEPEEQVENAPEEPIMEESSDVAEETETIEEVTPEPTAEEASSGGDPQPSAPESSPEVEEESEESETPEPINETPEEPEPEPEEPEPEPELDGRALYGTQGTNTGDTDGASLALSGWVWDFKPEPNDPSSEVGKIVYQIVVDEDGYLVKIETLTSTVSPTVERKYRQAVEKLTFSKTSDYRPAPLSTGTLTFIIKSK
ncbi:MAG: hypothetical protein AAGA66_15030 [Bacteroidota bacterium]